MAYQTKLLLRTSLSDVGDMSGHGSYCSSPDMIVHSLVKDPKATFATSDSYGKDPTEKIDRCRATNPKEIQGGWHEIFQCACLLEPQYLYS